MNPNNFRASALASFLHKQFRCIWRLLTCLLIVATLLPAAPATVTAAPLPQPAPPSNYTYADCRRVDKETLRSEIEANALRVLTEESSPLDIDKLVERKWGELGVDKVIDSEVAFAVQSLQNNESYWDRLWSGWSADKADEFATRIISDTFNSAGFKSKIGELSTAIGNEVARNIQTEFARAASVAFLCLQEYVGERYSDTLFTAFEKSVTAETDQVNITGTTDVDVSLLSVHQGALTGVGVIVVTEITRRVAVKLGEKIAQRIAGKIIGRVLGKAGTSLIPVAGWVVGLAMIAYDLWQGGQGALPEIQESLQSEEVKVKIREEISTAIQEGLPQEAAIAAVEISASLTDEWHNFCTREQYICLLSDESADFRSLLNLLPVSDLNKLSQLVNVFMTSLGRSELDAAIINGNLEKLVALPPEAPTLLASTKSVTATLAWSELATSQLSQIATYGVHLRKSPTDFDRDSLQKLLALNDPGQIEKLTLLPTKEMTPLLALPADALQNAAATFSQDQLQWLAKQYNQPDATPVAQLTERLSAGQITSVEIQEMITATLASGVGGEANSPIDSIIAMTYSPTPAQWIGIVVAFLALVLLLAVLYAWRQSARS